MSTANVIQTSSKKDLLAERNAILKELKLSYEELQEAAARFELNQQERAKYEAVRAINWMLKSA